MTIKETIESPDIKSHSFAVDAIENGFKVVFSYRQRDPEKKKDDYNYWDYKSKIYFFPSWTETVKFLGDNEIPQPPK